MDTIDYVPHKEVIHKTLMAKFDLPMKNMQKYGSLSIWVCAMLWPVFLQYSNGDIAEKYIQVSDEMGRKFMQNERRELSWRHLHGLTRLGFEKAVAEVR